MRLEQLELGVDAAVGSPMQESVASPVWEAAFAAGVIPSHLNDFNAGAGYFAIDQAPRFLADDDRLLFSFLGGLVQGLGESFEEAHDLLDEIEQNQGKGYAPIKRLRGEDFDPRANARKQRAFKRLIVSIAAILDQFAEVVSVLFHGDVETLTVGRASFTVLRQLSRKAYAPSGAISSAREARFEKLHTVLVDDLESTDEEQDWYELFTLYRHKLAHMGSSMFHLWSFHDSNWEFYTFTPNCWPLFHQSMIHEVEAKAVGGQGVTDYVYEYYIEVLSSLVF